MKKVCFILVYTIIFFNSNLFSDEKNKILKVGLLAPLSGEYKNLGNSLLYALQLALEEIDDKNVLIFPRDSGFNNKDKLNSAVQDIKAQGANIIIGPLNYEEFDQIKKYNDMIFISPSNINPEFTNNTISIGISLESQLMALADFIKKQNKTRTLIMFPKSNYTNLINEKLTKINLKFNTFIYNPNPEVLTGEIEKITNYTQRKRNLELRKKMFEDKEDPQSIKELERLDQLYTLGDVDFDSLIIIDFGDSLKSVLTSLIYSDVSQEKVLFSTINQWFDESIFYENTIKDLYYPSINYKEFKKYNKKYFNKFKLNPNEITILAYDALGLIYYAWKNNNNIKSINDFSFKSKIKGKIGTFSFKERKVTQELKIYRAANNKFTKF
tara:strand:+ start:322 stop:1470 length:1149 start_codon:yes stop_codon:yes gene_type:complete